MITLKTMLGTMIYDSPEFHTYCFDYRTNELYFQGELRDFMKTPYAAMRACSTRIGYDHDAKQPTIIVKGEWVDG